MSGWNQGGHSRHDPSLLTACQFGASFTSLSLLTDAMRGQLLLALFLIFCLVPSTLTSCSSGPHVRWRSDGRCGANFQIVGGVDAECDPLSERPCCSDYGYCGNSDSHCSCPGCLDYRNIIREPECYYSLRGTAGYLQSPNFPNPYPVSRKCCYDIQRPSQTYCGVRFTVDFLDVGRPEEHGYCQTDWLSVPSCAPERGTRICGNETGQIFQYLFQPGSSSLRLFFRAGNFNERRKGFRIKYELLESCEGPYQSQNPPVSIIPGTNKAPCYTRITDARGTINTPYYPKTYPDNLDCVYEFIRTHPNTCGIKMETVAFEMEHPLSTIFGGACKDFLHLPSCGFLCGKINFSWIVEFQPGATSIRFHFHSDEVKGHSGFLIEFEQVTVCV